MNPIDMMVTDYNCEYLGLSRLCLMESAGKSLAEEVGKICNAYNAIDIDFTVLLTHIGFEEDKKLAELLDPNWGIDLIIGGHSHTLLEKPEVVAGIPIVQAAYGTSQIGRFDIMVDTDNNCIHDYEWKYVPINAENCPNDEAIEKILNSYMTLTKPLAIY